MSDESFTGKLDEYQQLTEQTAIYPDELPEFVSPGLLYVVLGFTGEAGEVAEKAKKAIREDDPSYLEELEDELGDTLWYWARICEELDADAGEIAEANLEKLLDRQDRDVLTGSGDDR